MEKTITTEQVKQLRDETGVSVMQCRKALVEAQGDMEKALLILKKNSVDIASKKADREAKEGLIAIKSNGTKASVVILNCETDFVAKNDDFIKLANELAEVALLKGTAEAEKEADEKIKFLIQKIGENMKLAKVEIIEGKNLGVYIHNDKKAVIAKLSGGKPEVAKDVAMHIAAMKPEFIKKEDIAKKDHTAIASLFAEEVAKLDKPEETKKKILDGKIDTYFKERTLLEQPFIKNGDITIGNMVKNEGVEIEGFLLFSLV